MTNALCLSPHVLVSDFGLNVDWRMSKSMDHEVIASLLTFINSYVFVEQKGDNIRETAYTLLLEKYQEYDENATKAMVKVKINRLRSTYNKELKKDSEESGAGS